MSNEYYDHLTAPATASQLSSAIIRAEFQKIEAAFSKFPALTVAAGKMLVVNGTGTEVVASDAPDINGGAINGASVGAAVPSSGAFTTLSASGSATAPTLAQDTNTTGIATTAFVIAQGASASPVMNGAAAPGSAIRFSKSDHVHPSDTSRAPTASPTFTGPVTLGQDPVSNLQAATKQYVDALATGVDTHEACVCATTANISLSGLAAIDGITPIANDRILVKNQTTTSQNGIYLAAAGAWSRSLDANATGEIKQGTYVFVNGGTVNAKTGWTQQTSGTITIGTTPILFAQFSSALTYSAGTGLSLAGTTFSLSLAPVANGGTGVTSFAAGGILAGNGASAIGIATGAQVAAALGTSFVANASFATTATNASHLAGGAAGAIPYQSGAGATAFSAVGTAGQVLRSGGTGVPTWGTLAVAAGGTGATNAPAALTALGACAVGGGNATGTGWNISITGSANSATTATSAGTAGSATALASGGNFAGPVAGMSGVNPTNGLFRSTPNFHINTPANNGVFVNYDNGATTGTTVNFAVGNGVSGNAFTVTAAGTVVATGDITAFSDLRVKANLAPITGALDKVTWLTGYTFTRTDQDDKAKRHAGVIAQEVLAALPEVVVEDEHGNLSVAYGNMAALFIEAIKELNATVKQLREEVETLKRGA